MKDVPSVPAQTVLKHIQSSKNRIKRLAEDAERFRTGLRELQTDAITLRNVLEERPEELAKMEAGLMAISYAASGILNAFDQVVRFELGFQSEAQRWLHGKTPAIERGRPQVQYQQAPNGKAVPAEAYEYIKATAQEIPTPKPDPKIAVGYYVDEASKQRVYVNAYNEVVEPPVEKKESIAVPLDLPAPPEDKPAEPPNGVS